jgi:outer membrane protein assembly factor BamE
MRLLLTLALALFLTTGCNLVYKQNIQQGNAIEQEDLDKLRIGMTRNQVSFLLGTPAIRDPFHQDRWDYVSTFSRRGEDAVMRKVTLYFENGVLSEMIGVEGDEFIFDEEEPAANAVEDGIVTEAGESASPELTPLATPGSNAAPFEDVTSQPSAEGATDAIVEDAPNPVAPTPSHSQPTVPELPAVPEEIGATDPAEQAIAPAQATSSGWAVQLGAFDEIDNANALLERLNDAGIDAAIMQQPTSSGARYLVRKAGFDSRAEAENLIRQVASVLGINGFVVRPED